MKKNIINFIILTVLISIIGVIIIKVSELYFGAAEVYAFIIGVVMIVGVFYIPYLQYKQRKG